MRVRNVLELFPKEHPFKRSRRRRERIVVFLLVLCYTVTSVQAFLPIGQRSRRSLPSKRDYNTDTSEPRQQERVRQSSDATITDDDTKQQKNPGWVSNSQLEELKDSVDIVTVVESYGLERFAKRQGDNTKATAVCPFHNDRNPSLNIDGSRRLYKCFACGAGGDVFNFVREYSKVKTGQEISFYQAVRRVNKEFGDGTMGDSTASGGRGGPRLSDEERQALQAKKDRILLANAAAATFYTECLTQPFGGRARSHLQSRGLPALAARSFALGYAPDAYYGKDTPRSQWGVASLVNRLRDLEFTPQEILDAGLAIRTKKEAPPLSSVEVQSQPECKFPMSCALNRLGPP
jgi:DNA primase